MAGVGFKAISGIVASGTSAKTIIQLVAATNQRALVRNIAVSFNGTSATNAPVLVRAMRQDDAGTMSSLTLGKFDTAAPETLQTTGRHTATAEPTSNTTLWSRQIHPQTGIDYQFPFDNPLPIPGGTRLGIVVTAANDVGVVVDVEGEE